MNEEERASFKAHLLQIVNTRDNGVNGEANKVFAEVAEETGLSVVEVKVEYMAAFLASVLS